MQNKRKKMSVMMGAAAMAVLTVGSMAYFTDRVTGQATATARTLDLELTQNWAAASNKMIVPGDIVDFDYSLANKGNAAMDIKQKIVVSMPDVTMTSGTPEFAIYKATDLKQDAAGAWEANLGAKPLASGVANGNKVTFELPEISLNGSGVNGETTASATADKTTADYAILFSKDASNAFQGKAITVDYLAQAKQSTNTDDSTWATVQSETINFGGNASEKVVPEVPAP